MKNIDKLDVDAFIEKSMKNAKAELALKIYQNAVRMSPVDTGFFRSSWNCSASAIEPATGRGIMNANSVRSTVKAASEFEDIYVSNSVVYANEIENGSSKQAPTGILKNATFIALKQMN